MRQSRWARTAWPLFVICLLVASAAFAYLVAFPQYRQPTARLWNTWVGYPAILRDLGRPVPVSVVSAEKRHMVNVISAVGAVGFLDTVPVDTEDVGVIVNVPVQVGDHVNPGDMLLTVSTGGQEARQAQLDLDLKKWMYDKAKSDYDRDAKALKSGLVSQSVYDAMLASYREAEVNMSKARETLDSTIRSRSEKILTTAVDPPAAAGNAPTGSSAAHDAMQPDLATDLNGFGQRIPILALTAGTVTQVNAYVGQNLTQPTNKLMTIGDRLVFHASVDQSYFSTIKVGDRAKIYLQAVDGEPLEGKVVRIDPTVAGAGSPGGSGGPPTVPFTFVASLDINAKGQNLASGMNGYCLFSRTTETLAIPQAALMRYSGGQGVVGIVDSDNRARFVPVTYSINNEGWIAIDSGVSAGARVILDGQTGLRAGDKVSIR